MPSLEVLNRIESTSQFSTTSRTSAFREFELRLQAARLRELSHEARFLAWQRRWADAKGQLIQRLDAIDEQLARVGNGNRKSPKLAIVSHESHENDCRTSHDC